MGTPRCEYVPNDSPNDDRDRLQCKPAAVTVAMLPDGRTLFGNGIESEENAEEGVALALAPESRDSRTRTLDLRSGEPEFAIPENEGSDGDNPRIIEGRTSDDCLTDPENLPGVLGVPGRPGDGFVGSLAGQLGVPEQEPVCSPDDIADNDGDIFCADLVQMADGKVLLVGGTDWYNEPSILEKAEGDPVNVGVVELEGLQSARIFDPFGGEEALGRWDATTPMKFGRWYPSATTMPDGSVSVVSGTAKLIKSTQGSQVVRTETFDPDTEEWTENFSGPASEKTLPQNARVYLAPNGKLFYSGDGQMFGPFGQAVDQALFAQQGFFNFETDEWENTGLTVPRSSPASVTLPMQAPYDTMTIMRAGGTLGPPPGGYVAVPTTEFTTVDSAGTVTNEAGPLLNHPRWFTQPTPLPTGEVLLTSGARNDHVVAPGAELPVVIPEIYDPESDTFTSLSAPERARTYHNSAVLLPNGQVLVGGNSPISSVYGVQRDIVPGLTANNDKDSSFELFNPPYLHQGERPHIDGVQQGLAWGEDFTVTTDDAVDVSKVTLMRMPSPQHVMDNDTRTLELPFTDNGDGTLTAEMAPDGVAAPPGFYYLFINSAGGEGGHVPSVARIVQIGDTANTAEEAVEPMGPETVTDFTGNGATPTEVNTLFNNPPNPLEEPTIPGESDPIGGAVPEGIPGVTSEVPQLLDDPRIGGTENTQPTPADGSGTTSSEDSEGPLPPTDDVSPEGMLNGLTGSSDGRRRIPRRRYTRLDLR